MNKQLLASILAAISITGAAYYGLNNSSNQETNQTGLLKQEISNIIEENSADCPISPILKVPAGYQPIHISGLIDYGCKKNKSFADEVKTVFATLDKLLASVGANKNDVYALQVLLSCPKHYEEFFKLWQEYFGAHKPTRNTFVEGGIWYGGHARVKISGVAYVKSA